MNEIQQTLSPMTPMETMLPALVRDLAQDLYTVEEIIERHGLDTATVNRLLGSTAFKSMLDAAKAEWAAPGNAKSRAQLKAQIAVEEAIPELYTIVTDDKEAGPARVAAFTQLKEVGKFEKAPLDQSSSGGPGFSVIINLGEQSLKVTAPVIEGNVVEAAE